MRVILILLLTPALLYAATMGVLWLKVQSSADSLVQGAAPFARIDYDSIHISPLGDEIGLNDITIRPTMTQDVFRIEQLRLSAPHVGYFISASDSMEKGKMPEHMGLQLRRMQFDIGSELLTMSEQMQRQQQAMQRQQSASRQAGADFANALASLNALGCGNVDMFSLSDFRRMGIGTIVADVGFNIGYDEKRSRTHINANISADKLYQMDLGFDLAMTPGAMNRNTMQTLPTSTFTYRDTGYHTLRNQYCAGMNGGSKEDYVDRHIRLISEVFGATFPEKSSAAYRDFMLKGGSLNFRLEPQDGVSLAGLEYYKPGDIIDMLGLDVRINDTPVESAAIAWSGESKLARAPATPPQGDAVQQSARPATSETETTGAAPRQAESRYHVVDVGDAGKHLHKMVEVTTSDGKVRRGELNAVDAGRLTLIVRISAGSMSYPVESHLVDQFRVYY